MLGRQLGLQPICAEWRIRSNHRGMSRLVAVFCACAATFFEIANMDHGDGPGIRYRSKGLTFCSNSSGKIIPWMTSRIIPFLSITTVMGRVSPLSNMAFVCSYPRATG